MDKKFNPDFDVDNFKFWLKKNKCLDLDDFEFIKMVDYVNVRVSIREH